jgi:hypothetical protein
MQDPIQKKKKLKQKGLGGMIQVVEHLLSKSKALNSNPNTTSKKRQD